MYLTLAESDPSVAPLGCSYACMRNWAKIGSLLWDEKTDKLTSYFSLMIEPLTYKKHSRWLETCSGNHKIKSRLTFLDADDNRAGGAGVRILEKSLNFYMSERRVEEL